VKFDGLGPIANRFYETLQRGRANLPKPVDCHQITDRQKRKPYSETGTSGAIGASFPQPRFRLTSEQGTAGRCKWCQKLFLNGMLLRTELGS
jgi:hypothetical protein